MSADDQGCMVFIMLWTGVMVILSLLLIWSELGNISNAIEALAK